MSDDPKCTLRFPTDIRLLWEACEWLHRLMKKVCKELGERMPRSKYNDADKSRLTYAKQRKPQKERHPQVATSVAWIRDVEKFSKNI